MGTKKRHAGAPGKAPLLAQRNADMPSLSRGRNSPCRNAQNFSHSKGDLTVANSRQYLAGSLGSLGFQTCRIAYSLKSAGREAASAVGLEICVAAAPEQHAVAYNLSLSFAASCQR
jgi:hypothetical protein